MAATYSPAAVITQPNFGKPLLGCRFVRSQATRNKVTSVAFSANDLFVLTGSDDGTARIWDAATGLQLHAFPGGFSGMNAIAFSQDGRYVLTGKDENSERLWEAATGRELFSFEPAKLIMCAIFSPDGNYLVTAGRVRVQFWEVATGTEIRSFKESVR